MGPRKQLGKLILAGLNGRRLDILWAGVCRRFVTHGERAPSFTAFDNWCNGVQFPATAKRQKLLGDEVGGVAGQRIKELKPPPFRRRRRKVMEGEMSKERDFSRKWRMHGDKKMPFAEIVCFDCPDKSREWSPCHGDFDHVDYFERKGWSVGKRATQDKCPKCLEREARKVVRMQDHRKPDTMPEATPAPTAEIPKDEGRIISRYIEDHWDDQHVGYQRGWSDRKVAEEMDRAVEWIKAIRERDFGGSGDDPAAVDLVANLVKVQEQLAGFERDLQVLASTTNATPPEDLLQRYLKESAKQKESITTLQEKFKTLNKEVHRQAEQIARIGGFPMQQAG